jgi:hypothetical protein
MLTGRMASSLSVAIDISPAIVSQISHLSWHTHFMPILVHITDEKRSAAIQRSGIRLPRESKAIFFMPVLQSHFISHQWIRELRRGGARVLAGIYFRLESAEKVWAGRYNEPHQSVTLGEAIRELRSLKDPLGYEIFINRAIPPSAIHKIRTLPTTTGWRYMPHAHGKKVCGCPSCLRKGAIKSRKLRERLEPQSPLPSLNDVKARLLQSPTADEITDLLWVLRQKKRRSDPEFLEPLMASTIKTVLEDVAFTLPFFRHPRSKHLLDILSTNGDPHVASAAREGLESINKQQGVS